MNRTQFKLGGALSLALISAIALLALYAVGALDPILHLFGLGQDAGDHLKYLAEGAGATGFSAKTIADRIAEFEVKRTELMTQKQGIVTKATIEEGRTFDEHEAEQLKDIAAQVRALDETLVALKDHEKSAVAAANPVVRDAGRDANGVEVRPNAHISVKSNIEPGVRFTRFAKCMAMAKGNLMQAEQIAKEYCRDTPEVARSLNAAVSLGGVSAMVEKSAVAVGTTSDSAWAGPLVQYHDMASEFIQLLRPKMIIGRMNNLRRVPFMMRTSRQLTGVTGAFVGEGLPKPVGKQTYDNVTLGFAKAAVIVVMTDELVRFSGSNSPAADMLARDDMLAGISTYLDKRFIDPSYSGVANVSPASITNGARRVQSSGSTLAAIDTDVAAMMQDFTGSDVDPATASWVMSPTMALRLSMIRTTQGEFAFPDITMFGGTWYGLPVITSSAVTASGSPGEKQIALVTQGEVLMADDGSISIDMSMEASVQMNDTPSAGAQSLVSLWQNNLLGIRAERYINWGARRPSNLGISLLENVNY